MFYYRCGYTVIVKMRKKNSIRNARKILDFVGFEPCQFYLISVISFSTSILIKLL